MTVKNGPPVQLVKTWIGLLFSNEDDVVKEHAKKMLIDTFGDMKTAALFAEKHDIEVRR